MNIPSSAFIFIDIIICIIYVACIIVSYKKGFLYGLVKLLSTIGAIILAWILAPVVEGIYTFVKLSSTYSAKIETLVNTIIWFFIIFLVVKLVFLIISPIFKWFSKVPVLGFVNRVCGIVIGVLDATLVIMLFTMFLKTPIVKNSNEVINGTVLKYVDKYTSKGMEYIVDNIDADKLKDGVSGFDVDSTREQLKAWLKSQGLINE